MPRLPLPVGLLDPVLSVPGAVALTNNRQSSNYFSVVVNNRQRNL